MMPRPARVAASGSGRKTVINWPEQIMQKRKPALPARLHWARPDGSAVDGGEEGGVGADQGGVL